MKTFTIKYTEEYSGRFTVEAEDEEDAIDMFEYLASEGQIDFDDLDLIASDVSVV